MYQADHTKADRFDLCICGNAHGRTAACGLNQAASVGGLRRAVEAFRKTTLRTPACAPVRRMSAGFSGDERETMVPLRRAATCSSAYC